MLKASRARRLVSAPSLPPEAAKIIYRSMLKACANGRHPEVLKLDELNGEPLPHNPHGVVNLIRGSNAEPFASLKFAAECSRALHPPIGSLPQTLPAFVLPSHTLLPGEMADFVFFEPRYVTLARQVLALGNKSAAASGAPPDYRYAHLPEPIPGGVGTITSILDHQELPDGRVFVRVLAGPRLIVTKTARVEKVGASPSSSADGGRAALRELSKGEPPPLLHVEYEELADAEMDGMYSLHDEAREVFNQFSELVPLDKVSSINTNAPPLFDAERLSFWLCHCIIRNDDVMTRSKHLTSTSTAERLEFVSRAIAVATKARDEAGKSD